MTSLSARRPLGDRPLSPSGVVTELVPRACTCRKPARSGGVEENGRRSIPSTQSRDRGLIVPAPGSPSLVVDGNRAQDAPTCGTEAHSRAEVKSAQKSGARPEEGEEREASPEEVQPKTSARPEDDQ